MAADRRSGHDRRQYPAGRRANDDHESLITGGVFRIDDLRKAVYIKDKRYTLSPKEYSLLRLLLTNCDRVVSSEEILEHLWTERGRANKTDVKQYIHLLRKRIEDNPRRPRWVQSVRGYGYQLAVEEASSLADR